MKINKQAKREAKQLFRFCLVNGLLDENRVRNVVQHVVAAGRRDCPAILSHFRRLVRLDHRPAHGHRRERRALAAGFAGCHRGRSEAPVWPGTHALFSVTARR